MPEEKKQGGKFRSLSGFSAVLYKTVLTLIPIACIFYVADIHTHFGLSIYKEQYLGLFLAFYQELGYEVPPDEVDGRRTLGLRVPTDVLVSGRGDCDSKAVAFASMWRRFPTRAVMVLVPGHALVGVEVPARPGERTVRVGNRTYVLCEVAGPGKWHPGARSVEGSFEYVLVEPA